MVFSNRHVDVAKFESFDSDDKWFVPSQFLTSDNNIIDSREKLESAGFQVYDLARDTRFYKAVPPTEWSVASVGVDRLEIYNNRNSCVFVQEIRHGSFFDGGQVYWKDSEFVNS